MCVHIRRTDFVDLHTESDMGETVRAAMQISETTVRDSRSDSVSELIFLFIQLLQHVNTHANKGATPEPSATLK